MESSAPHEVARVLDLGEDEHGPWRRVRMTDGSERVQRPQVTVAGRITRAADGAVEDVEITSTGVHLIEED